MVRDDTGKEEDVHFSRGRADTDFEPVEDKILWIDRGVDVNDAPSSSPSSTVTSTDGGTPQVNFQQLQDCEEMKVVEVFDVMDLVDKNESENPKEENNDELGMIFLEWLKRNRDFISAEDMRCIKLNQSTIESASKHLGSTKEGKKQLLKLILEWVEQYQLKKKQLKKSEFVCPYKETLQINDPNPNPYFVYNLPDPATTAFPPPPPPPPPMYNGYSYSVVPPPPPPPQQATMYGPHPSQVLDPNWERMMNIEAGKKRMARLQRRMYCSKKRNMN
ncbi:hypothetical protein ACS0TY_004322 [Phlomoides rotata]